MALDQRGDIAIATIVFFVPIFCFALFLTLRHGFGRQAGWIFLLTFSIVRIVGGALHIAAEESNPPSVGLFIGAFSLESAGIAPLLLCTSSFLGLVGSSSLDGHPASNPKLFRLVRLVILVAFILAITGASEMTDSNANTRSTAQTLRRVGSILILAVFVLMAALHFVYWTYKDQILLHRRTLLLGISAALPFLTIRVVYSILSSFSPAATFGAANIPVVHNSLSKFNSFSGSWRIFLVMSLIMEYIVVLIYITVGTIIPLEKETNDYEMKGGDPQAEAYGSADTEERQSFMGAR